jgi:large subunit ribosomal protein L9
MPTNLQVVLTHDVDKLGKSGELVKVRPGFARNYLIPRGLAVAATAAAVSRIAHEKAVALAKAEKLKKEMKDLADKLSSLQIRIAVAAGEDDRLFGSVTAKDVHAAVKAKGVDFDRKKIVLGEPLKSLGTHEVTVKLLSDVVATLKVELVKK